MRPNNCKKCGGKLQMGGMPKQSDYPDYESWQVAQEKWMQSLSPQQSTPGWHNTPEDIDANGQTFNQRLPNSHPDNPRTGEDVGDYVSTTETTTQPSHNWNQDIFFGLRGTQMAASYLAGKKRNALMNQYDYKQQTALGQMNAMPISQFQYGPNDYTTPNRMYAQQGGTMNPYSYHSKYGGNLKTIIREHGKWTNDVIPMDMGDGPRDNKGMMKKGGFALDEMVVRDFISKLMQFGHGPHPYGGMHRSRYQMGGLQSGVVKPKYNFSSLIDKPTSLDSASYLQAFNQALTTPKDYYDERNTFPAFRLSMKAQAGSPEAKKWMGLSDLYTNAYQDAHSPTPLTSEQEVVQQELMKKMQMMGKRGLPTGKFKEGGRFMGINPAHKGYCTPMTKATCTPRRKALAMTLKKHHGFHQKGGNVTQPTDKQAFNDANSMYFQYLQQKGRRLPTTINSKEAEQAHQYMLRNMKGVEGSWSTTPIKDAGYQFGNTLRGWFNDLFGTHMEKGGIK